MVAKETKSVDLQLYEDVCKIYSDMANMKFGSAYNKISKLRDDLYKLLPK